MSIESPDELEGLRRAGRAVAEVLCELRRRVQPGVTTLELDRLAGRVFARHGARSAPMLVYDAPSEVFISVNDAAVHGLPTARRLVSAADAALRRALPLATAGARVRDVSAAISGEAAARGVSVLDGLGGHGIGANRLAR
jgi:methionyl aminopeptidase